MVSVADLQVLHDFKQLMIIKASIHAYYNWYIGTILFPDFLNAIKNSTSILDYVFRSIGYDYLGRKDFVHVKAVDELMDGDIDGKQKSNGAAEHIPVAEPALVVHAESTHSSPRQSQAYQAKVQGYTGEQCENCGSMRVKQNGTCKVCEDCGMTTGCS